MKNLYICDNYNHLLISIVKSLKSNDENYIIIYNNWTNNKLIEDKKLIDRVKQSDIFKNVIIFNDYYDEQMNILKNKNKILNYYIKKYKLTIKMIRNCSINFKDYDEIYMFYDQTIIGTILNEKKIEYKLLEDGTDCFKNNEIIIRQKRILRNFISKNVFKLNVFATSKYIKSIEVNDLNGVFIKNKKLIECPRKKIFENLNRQQKDKIINIFLDKYNWTDINDCTLILTQPLFIDKLVDSEEKEIKIYQNIITSYCKDEKIVIKTHPRDIVDFRNMNKNYKIITEIFPIEIINFFKDIKFNKIITISSTSINLINNCDEKIILGWDWLENIKDKI